VRLADGHDRTSVETRCVLWRGGCELAMAVATSASRPRRHLGQREIQPRDSIPGFGGQAPSATRLGGWGKGPEMKTPARPMAPTSGARVTALRTRWCLTHALFDHRAVPGTQSFAAAGALAIRRRSSAVSHHAAAVRASRPRARPLRGVFGSEDAKEGYRRVPRQADS